MVFPAQALFNHYIMALLFFIFTFIANAAEVADTESPRRSFWWTEMRAGYVLSNPDGAVHDHWQHEVSHSQQVAGGLFKDFSLPWPQLRIFVGGELIHLWAKETLGASSLDIKITQVNGTGGVTYLPYWWPRLGMSLRIALQAWGIKKTSLTTPGFSEDFPTEDPNEGHIGILGPAILGLTGFYQVNDQWRPFLYWENRPFGSALTAGAQYVF